MNCPLKFLGMWGHFATLKQYDDLKSAGTKDRNREADTARKMAMTDLADQNLKSTSPPSTSATG